MIDQFDWVEAKRAGLQLRQILNRIYGDAIFVNFEMEVVSRGSPRTAHFSDQVATRDVIPHIRQQLAAVTIKSFIAVLMIDDYAIAITTFPSGKLHNATVRRQNSCAAVSRKVDTLVHFGTTAKGMFSVTKRAAEAAIGLNRKGKSRPRSCRRGRSLARQ